MLKEIKLKSERKFELIDITAEVEKIVKSAKIKEGVCLVYAPHATAGIVINEGWDESVPLDFLDALDRVIPLHAGWRHDAIDGNAAAHIKSALVGPSELVPIKDGKLALGTWQKIFFCEFDGPRKERKVYVLVK